MHDSLLKIKSNTFNNIKAVRKRLFLLTRKDCIKFRSRVLEYFTDEHFERFEKKITLVLRIIRRLVKSFSKQKFYWK